MSWDCCNPRGECRMGPGCPAGVLLDQPQRTSAKTTPTPAARTGTPTHVDLRRVQLVAKAKPQTARPLLAALLIAVAKGVLVGFACVGVVTTIALYPGQDTTPRGTQTTTAKVTT